MSETLLYVIMGWLTILFTCVCVIALSTLHLSHHTMMLIAGGTVLAYPVGRVVVWFLDRHFS